MKYQYLFLIIALIAPNRIVAASDWGATLQRWRPTIGYSCLTVGVATGLAWAGVAGMRSRCRGQVKRAAHLKKCTGILRDFTIVFCTLATGTFLSMVIKPRIGSVQNCLPEKPESLIYSDQSPITWDPPPPDLWDGVIRDNSDAAE